MELERVKGIEPSYAAWEAAVLPLNYTRLGQILLQGPLGMRRLPCVKAAREDGCYDWPRGSRQNSPMIELSVNGELKRVPASIDIAGLLDALTLAGKKVAVERNGEIVPRSAYASTALAAGDRLEIVVAVGGG